MANKHLNSNYRSLHSNVNTHKDKSRIHTKISNQFNCTIFDPGESSNKALPIYDPNAPNKKIKIPIDFSKKQTNVEEWKISDVTLLHEPPVVGSELNVLVYVTNSSMERVFYKEMFDIDVRWSRGIKRMCTLNYCQSIAKIQCLDCVRLKVSEHHSYFCSDEHLLEAFPSHKMLHKEKASNKLFGEGRGEKFPEDMLRPDTDNDYSAFQFSLNKIEYEEGLKKHGNLNNAKELRGYFPPVISNIWADSAHSATYIPSNDDAGRQLLVEFTLIDRATKNPTKIEGRYWTSPVVQRFSLPQKRLLVQPRMKEPLHPQENFVFRVSSFNVLADIYAKNKKFPHLHSRYLQWNYREKRLKDQILSHKSNIVCMQEIQQSHYNDVFLPMFAKLGYEGVYKKKTRDVSYIQSDVDGCAIFFDKSIFKLVQKFSIEFNEAVEGIIGTEENSEQTRRRLMRDNVAIVCILEALIPKRRLCVVNTHIYWDPQFSDVKLWQSLILCEELETLREEDNITPIPIILAGDFNSTPDSNVYELLCTGKVYNMEEVLANDQYGIFKNHPAKHDLKLESAYKTALLKEPPFTNYTVDFKGCIDYIMFTPKPLGLVSVLDIYPEEVLAEYKALPSPRLASDHIGLAADFAFRI